VNSILTFTHTCTRTNTVTNTITNTYTHTNFPLRKASADKALRRTHGKRWTRNSDASVDFNHIGYPPTLPRQILTAGGETPYAKDTKSSVFRNISDKNMNR